MKSIGARLALWYAFASILALSCLFRVGRYLLEQHILNSLDLMNTAQFEQISRRFGPDPTSLTPGDIQELVRETSEHSSVRFYIEVRKKGGGLVCRSNSLGGHAIPDVPAKGEFTADFFTALFKYRKLDLHGLTASRNFNVVIEDLGELRVSEFSLGALQVRLAVSKGQVRQMLKGYEEVFAILFVGMLAVSGAIGYGLSWMALRPVRLIQRTANHISSDNLSERIPVPAVQDEISNLARLLNQMFDRLESSFNQARRFTAEASHELKTPLSLVRLQTEKLLMDGGLTHGQEESLQIVLEEVTRLNQIIEEMLFLSRAEAHAVTIIRKTHLPKVFMESFAQDARVLADARGMRLLDRHTGDGQVDFDARWLRQVLLNLLANALNHSPPGGSITISSQITPAGWQVAVEDEGPGVPAPQRERIFERFVRLGKQDENGSGLGLAISRSIVQLHNGRIWAEDPTHGHGLRVVFELPV